MSYKINKADEHIVMPDGPITAREMKRYMKQQNTPEFYELEAAEVIKVLLDDEDLPFIPETGERDYTKYGCIHARMAVSNTGKQDIKIIAPLDPNIKDYPYPGEYVIVADYLGDTYYTQKINMRNNVHSNIVPGLSKIYNPFDGEVIKSNLPEVQNPKIRQLKAEEGDITFNGRFGNSIRLGSNVKEILTDDGIEENTGKENSPNVIIRAGQGILTEGNKPVNEDINLDSSSLWMTTKQVVPFEKSSTKAHGKTVPQKYDGKQIIINSDRIVFNSKLNSIHAFSKNEISMAADRRMNLESPIVNLADRMATQPAVAGDILMDDIIWKIVDALIEFGSGIAPTMGSVVGFPVPLDNVVGPSSMLADKLSKLKSTMKDSAKSETVFVGNPKGANVG